MDRYFAIAVAALLLATGASCASAAGEMAMPGASIGTSTAAETETSVRQEVASPATPRAASVSNTAEEAHPHRRPDSVTETRADGRAPAAGADSGAGSGEAAGKRHHGPWQSLLPGVMK